MLPPVPNASIHTDAADVGYGGTRKVDTLLPGVNGQWKAQGIWSWQDRANSITYRELKHIRVLLSGYLETKAVERMRIRLLLNVDNQAVVHITNAFVSASRPLMREIRCLQVVLDRLGFQIRPEYPLSAKQVRRWTVAKLLPRRLADTQAAQAFRSGWNESTNRLLSISSHRALLPGAPALRSLAGVQEAVVPVEPRPGSAALSPSGPNTGNSARSALHTGTGGSIDPGLAVENLTRGSIAPCEPRRNYVLSAAGNMGSTPEAQPQMSSVDVGSQSRVSPTAQCLALADTALSRLVSPSPSPRMLMSSRLLCYFSWSERTSSSRSSQWRTWIEFCTADGRPLLPGTEAHFIAYVMWFVSEREAGRRTVSSSSLP